MHRKFIWNFLSTPHETMTRSFVGEDRSPNPSARTRRLLDPRVLPATPLTLKEAQIQYADLYFKATEDTGHINNLAKIDSATGNPIDWFVDAEEWGASIATWEGDDFVYTSGDMSVKTHGGNDFISLGDNIDTASEYYSAIAEAGAGNDKIYAAAGSQRGEGGVGKDVLRLGDGSDRYSGGQGEDLFIIDLSDSGRDLIIDFQDKGDRISILKGGQAAKNGDWYLEYETPYVEQNYGDVPKDFLYGIDPGKSMYFNVVDSDSQQVVAQIAMGSSLEYDDFSTFAITVLKGDSDLVVDSVAVGADPSATFIG